MVLNSLTPQACREMLINNIIPFWSHKMIDKENNGFYGRIDGNNRLHPEADKGIILNSRILWTFSSIYLNTKDQHHLNIANRAYEYIISYFLDAENGGVYWMVDYLGNVVNDKKQIYALAFTIYALSEYYKINQKKEVLDIAIDLYQLIEKHSLDKNGGYLEAFSATWDLMEDLRLSEKDNNEAKTMNTHLHILEAYTNLYRIWPDEDLREKLQNLIVLFLDKFVDETGHFHLFFDEEWNLKSDKFSFGHDIEGGWLIYQAAEVLDNAELIARCAKAAIQMTNAALTGMDDDGGLMNEGDDRGIEDSDKHWWPQAEALVGLYNAWQISGEEKYLHFAENTWFFIQNKIVDQENGEWHWMTNKKGIVDTGEDKAGPWKCPYHNGRAMLELINRMK